MVGGNRRRRDPWQQKSDEFAGLRPRLADRNDWRCRSDVAIGSLGARTG